MKSQLSSIELGYAEKFFEELSWSSKYNQIVGVLRLSFDEFILKFDKIALKDGRNSNLAYCPDWSSSNPYQTLLYAGIKKNFNTKAIPVAFTEVIADPLEFAFKYRYLHLHWIHGWVDHHNKNKVEEALRVLTELKDSGVIIIWTVHNLFVHDTGGSSEELYFRSKLAKLVDFILVHSKYARDLILEKYDLEKYKKNILVSNHGHYEQVYGESRDSIRCKKILKIKSDSFVIGCIGEIKPYKGILEFLEEASKIISNYENVLIYIAGACKDKLLADKILSYANKNIKINIGRIHDNELRNNICACDVLAIPYKKYLTSGAAILGFTYGKPVIYAEGSITEIASYGEVKLGWSYGANGDFQSLNKLLVNILSNTENTRNCISKMDFKSYLHRESFSEISKLSLDQIFK
jgi:glycosyltransferase involved in cell wall biosynthesis